MSQHNIDAIIDVLKNIGIDIENSVRKEPFNKISIRHEKNIRGIYPIRVTPIVDLLRPSDVKLFMKIDGIPVYYTKKYRDVVYDDRYVLLIRNKDTIRFANKFDGFVKVKPRDNYLLKNNAFWFIKMLIERSNDCEIYVDNMDENMRIYFINLSNRISVA